MLNPELRALCTQGRLAKWMNPSCLWLVGRPWARSRSIKERRQTCRDWNSISRQQYKASHWQGETDRQMNSAGNKCWKLWEGWDPGRRSEELSQGEEEEGQREQPVQRLRGKASWNSHGEECLALLPFEQRARDPCKMKTHYFQGMLFHSLCRGLKLFLLLGESN